MNRKTIQLWDPREKQDFVFGSNKKSAAIASAARNFAVISIPPEVEILSDPSSGRREKLLSSLPLEGAAGFVCAFACPHNVEMALGASSERNGQSLLGIFPGNEENFRAKFSLVASLTHGELTIGSMPIGANPGLEHSSAFASDSSWRDADLLTVISKIGDLNWLFSYYADNGEAIIVGRPSIVAPLAALLAE